MTLDTKARTAMSWSEALYERARKQQAELQLQLEMMEAGKFQTHEMRNGSFVDTTEASKDCTRRSIETYARVIERLRPDEAEDEST